MSFTSYHNISGAVATNSELLPIKAITKQKISSISISNTLTVRATVSLYLFKESTDTSASESYYFFKNTVIPPGSSLLLDDTSLVSFDSINYSLHIQVGTSDRVDVMINK